MQVEFVARVQQPAVFGNPRSLHRRRAEPVAQHAHHLVVHLQQGFVQQRGAGLAQLGKGVRGGQCGEFLAMPRHPQLLQRPQRIERLADERDADPERTQTLELRRDAEGLGGTDRRRRENDFNLGVRALGQRGDRRFGIGEFEEQSAKTEIANFAGDFGIPGLRDDRRLRHLKAPVAPQFLRVMLNVCLVRHHFHTLSLLRAPPGSFNDAVAASPYSVNPASPEVTVWRDSRSFGRLLRMIRAAVPFFSRFAPFTPGTPQAVGRR